MDTKKSHKPVTVTPKDVFGGRRKPKRVTRKAKTAAQAATSAQEQAKSQARKQQRRDDAKGADRVLLVAGASGFVGSAFVAAAQEAGWQVRTLTRGEATDSTQSVWDPARGQVDPQVLAAADAVVCLNGKNLTQGMLTPAGRRELISSRLLSVRTLAEGMAALPQHARPRTFVSISAIGYYGDGGENELTETAVSGDGFLADLCDAWETAAQSAADAGVRVVNPRFGLVWGPGGGIAQMMLPLYERHLGAQFGDGQQWQSLISLEDVCAALLWVIDADVEGAVNFICPEPIRQGEWHRRLSELCESANPLLAPAPLLRLIPGQVGEQMLLVSQRVVPGKLLDGGFEFAHPSVADVLRSAI